MISHMVLLTVFTLISVQDLYFPPHIKSTYLYFCISNSSWIKGVSSWIKGVGVGKGRSGEDQYNKMLFSLKIPIFGIRNSLEQSTVLHSNGLYHSPSSQLILYDNTIPNYVLCWTLSTFPTIFQSWKQPFPSALTSIKFTLICWIYIQSHWPQVHQEDGKTRSPCSLSVPLFLEPGSTTGWWGESEVVWL